MQAFKRYAQALSAHAEKKNAQDGMPFQHPRWQWFAMLFYCYKDGQQGERMTEVFTRKIWWSLGMPAHHRNAHSTTQKRTHSEIKKMHPHKKFPL